MRYVGMLLLSAALAAGGANAQMKDHAGHSSPPAKSDARPHKGIAVVKSLDVEKGIVMLAHEPIQSLGWPAMTMKFTARDKKMLAKIALGNKVEFEFFEKDRNYILTSIKPVASR